MISSNGGYYIGLYFLISRILPQSTMVILRILRCCRMPWVNWAQMWTLSAPDWHQEVDGLENPTTEELVCVSSGNKEFEEFGWEIWVTSGR